MAGIQMLEYVYTKQQHKRSMTILLSLWAALFLLRVVLFSMYGWDFVFSSYNLTLVSVSGTLVGLIIRTLIIRKRSVELSPETITLPVQQ